MTNLKKTYLEQIIHAWQELQHQKPLVQCITNTVASHYTANILLAAGAAPAMIDHPNEAAAFTQASQALLINLGTPTSEQVTAMHLSAQTAQDTQTPWVLDPVGYGAILAWRSEIIRELLNYTPSVIRANAAEMAALAGQHTIQTKGVDSEMSSDFVHPHVTSLWKYSPCLALSGESDYIVCRDLKLTFKVNGGSPLLPRITATGCALGALTAAYCAVASPAIAALTAHVQFAIAGKLAHNQAQTLGSFNTMFLDYLHMMDSNLFHQYADFEIIPDSP